MGRLPFHHRVEIVGVREDPGRAVDPQRVAATGNQGQSADLRALQYVEVAVDPLVARPFRDRDGGVVDDVNETGRIAFRGDVDAAPCIGRRNEAERRVRQPIPLHRREPVLDLVRDGLLRFSDDRTEVLDRGDYAAHGYIMLA